MTSRRVRAPDPQMGSVGNASSLFGSSGQPRPSDNQDDFFSSFGVSNSSVPQRTTASPFGHSAHSIDTVIEEEEPESPNLSKNGTGRFGDPSRPAQPSNWQGRQLAQGAAPQRQLAQRQPPPQQKPQGQRQAPPVQRPPPSQQPPVRQQQQQQSAVRPNQPAQQALARPAPSSAAQSSSAPAKPAGPASSAQGPTPQQPANSAARPQQQASAPAPQPSKQPAQPVGRPEVAKQAPRPAAQQQQQQPRPQAPTTSSAPPAAKPPAVQGQSEKERPKSSSEPPHYPGFIYDKATNSYLPDPSATETWNDPQIGSVNGRWAKSSEEAKKSESQPTSDSKQAKQEQPIQSQAAKPAAAPPRRDSNTTAARPVASGQSRAQPSSPRADAPFQSFTGSVEAMSKSQSAAATAEQAREAIRAAQTAIMSPPLRSSASLVSSPTQSNASLASPPLRPTNGPAKTTATPIASPRSNVSAASLASPPSRPVQPTQPTVSPPAKSAPSAAAPKPAPSAPTHQGKTDTEQVKEPAKALQTHVAPPPRSTMVKTPEPAQQQAQSAAAVPPPPRSGLSSNTASPARPSDTDSPKRVSAAERFRKAGRDSARQFGAASAASLLAELDALVAPATSLSSSASSATSTVQPGQQAEVSSPVSSTLSPLASPTARPGTRAPIRRVPPPTVAQQAAQAPSKAPAPSTEERRNSLQASAPIVSPKAASAVFKSPPISPRVEQAAPLLSPRSDVSGYSSSAKDSPKTGTRTRTIVPSKPMEVPAGQLAPTSTQPQQQSSVQPPPSAATSRDQGSSQVPPPPRAQVASGAPKVASPPAVQAPTTAQAEPESRDETDTQTEDGWAGDDGWGFDEDAEPSTPFSATQSEQPQASGAQKQPDQAQESAYRQEEHSARPSLENQFDLEDAARDADPYESSYGESSAAQAGARDEPQPASVPVVADGAGPSYFDQHDESSQSAGQAQVFQQYQDSQPTEQQFDQQQYESEEHGDNDNEPVSDFDQEQYDRAYEEYMRQQAEWDEQAAQQGEQAQFGDEQGHVETADHGADDAPTPTAQPAEEVPDVSVEAASPKLEPAAGAEDATSEAERTPHAGYGFDNSQVFAEQVDDGGISASTSSNYGEWNGHSEAGQGYDYVNSYPQQQDAASYEQQEYGQGDEHFAGEQTDYDRFADEYNRQLGQYDEPQYDHPEGQDYQGTQASQSEQQFGEDSGQDQPEAQSTAEDNVSHEAPHSYAQPAHHDQYGQQYNDYDQSNQQGQNDQQEHGQQLFGEGQDGQAAYPYDEQSCQHYDAGDQQAQEYDWQNQPYDQADNSAENDAQYGQHQSVQDHQHEQGQIDGQQFEASAKNEAVPHAAAGVSQPDNTQHEQQDDRFEQQQNADQGYEVDQGSQQQFESSEQNQYDQAQYDQFQYDQQQNDQYDQNDQGQAAQGQYDQGQHDEGQYDQGQFDQAQYGYDQTQHDQGQYDQGQYDQGQYDQGQYDQGQYDQGQYDPSQYQGDYDSTQYDQYAAEYEQQLNQTQYDGQQHDQQQYPEGQEYQYDENYGQDGQAPDGSAQYDPSGQQGQDEQHYGQIDEQGQEYQDNQQFDQQYEQQYQQRDGQAFEGDDAQEGVFTSGKPLDRHAAATPQQGSNAYGGYNEQGYYESPSARGGQELQTVLDDGALGLSGSRAPAISFGFGGKLVVAFAPTTSGYGAPYGNSGGTSTLAIHKLPDLIASDFAASDFPGPLFNDGGKAAVARKRKEVVAWLDKRIEEYDSEAKYFERAPNGQQSLLKVKARSVLYALCKVMVEHDGRLNGSSNIEQAVKAVFSAPTSAEQSSFATAGELTNGLMPDSPSLATYSVTAADLDRMTSILLRGERKEAVRYAIDRRMWAHAFIIASSIDTDCWKEVTTEFLRSELTPNEASPKELRGREDLRVAYSVFAGLGSDSVKHFVPPTSLASRVATPLSQDGSPRIEPKQVPIETLEQWRETVGMIVANRSVGDSAALMALGDALAASDCVEAAHICYLLSGNNVCGAPGLPTTRIMLLGANLSTDLEDIRLTEVLEFAMSLVPVARGQEAFAGLPHLQPLKLLHARRLADLGKVQQAQRYIEAISSTVKGATRPNQFYNTALAVLLKSLSERLGAVSVDKSGSWIGRKVPRPTMETLWSGLEGRFTKFVAGEGDGTAKEPARPIITTPSNEPNVGPFSHYSAISPMSTSGTLSRQQSHTDLAAAATAASTAPPPSSTNGPSQPSFTAPTSLAPGGNSNLSVPVPRPKSAAALRAPAPPAGSNSNLNAPAAPPASASNGPPPVKRAAFKTHHQRSSSLGFAGYNYDPNAPPPWQSYQTPNIAKNQQQQETQPAFQPQEQQGYEQGDDEFGQNDEVRQPAFQTVEEDFAADESGFINPMANLMPSIEPASTSGYRVPDQSHRRTTTQDELDDLGIVNSKSRKPQFEAINEDSSERENEPATQTASSSSNDQNKAQSEQKLNSRPSRSWLGGWFRRDSPQPKEQQQQAGSGPVRAKLGEETSFVYDPQLKRWVNKKAGADTPPPTAIAPPPRAQTASPSQASRAHLTSETPPPVPSLNRSKTVADLNGMNRASTAPPSSMPPIARPPSTGLSSSTSSTTSGKRKPISKRYVAVT